MPSTSVPVTLSRTGEMTTDGFMDIPDPKSVDFSNVPIVK